MPYPAPYDLLSTNDTATATITVGIGVAIYSQNRIKSRELEEADRESEIELHNKFIGFVVRILAGTNELTTGVAPSEQEMTDFMVEYKRDLVLRASPRILKAQLEYEKAAQDPERAKRVLIYVGKLIKK